MSLLITLTLDGYLEIMMPCMAIAGDDMHPRTAANPSAFVFFFAYINICVFAIMQLMIGIIFYHYAKVKSTREGKDHLDLQQRQWLTLSAFVFQAQPPITLQEPNNMIRQACFRIAISDWFEHAVTVTVLLNVIMMGASWHPPNQSWIRIQVRSLNSAEYFCALGGQKERRSHIQGQCQLLMNSINRSMLLLCCAGNLECRVQRALCSRGCHQNDIFWSTDVPEASLESL